MWAKFWCMSFNEVKSECLLTSRRQVPTGVTFQMNGKNLLNVESHNHLGLTLNQPGDWKDHINKMIIKVQGRLGLFRAMKYSLGRSSLDKMYKAFIRPLLEYCDVVWDGIPNYRQNRKDSN